MGDIYEHPDTVHLPHQLAVYLAQAAVEESAYAVVRFPVSVRYRTPARDYARNTAADQSICDPPSTPMSEAVRPSAVGQRTSWVVSASRWAWA